MKKYLLSAVLLFPSLAGAQTTPATNPTRLDQLMAGAGYVLSDIRANTKLRIDSTQPGSVFDNANGRWLIGTNVPFLYIGNYLHMGAGLYTPVEGGRNVPMVSGGLRMNQFTRPVLESLLKRVPELEKNAPLVAAIAKATTVGFSGGHDFNLPAKKKLVVNSYGAFMGFEFRYGN